MSDILDMWDQARKINPGLPYDIAGRQLRMSFSRDGSFATASQPATIPRKHPVPARVVIPLGEKAER